MSDFPRHRRGVYRLLSLARQGSFILPTALQRFARVLAGDDPELPGARGCGDIGRRHVSLVALQRPPAQRPGWDTRPLARGARDAPAHINSPMMNST